MKYLWTEKLNIKKPSKRAHLPPNGNYARLHRTSHNIFPAMRSDDVTKNAQAHRECLYTCYYVRHNFEWIIASKKLDSLFGLEYDKGIPILWTECEIYLPPPSPPPKTPKFLKWIYLFVRPKEKNYQPQDTTNNINICRYFILNVVCFFISVSILKTIYFISFHWTSRTSDLLCAYEWDWC